MSDFDELLDELTEEELKALNEELEVRFVVLKGMKYNLNIDWTYHLRAIAQSQQGCTVRRRQNLL